MVIGAIGRKRHKIKIRNIRPELLIDIIIQFDTIAVLYIYIISFIIIMPNKNLLYAKTNCYDTWNTKKVKTAYDFAEQYKEFLGQGKTERLIIQDGIKRLKKAGFIPLEQLKNEKSFAGKKVYVVNREKALVACILGKKPVTEGMNMILTHIDSPRLDMKVNPCYEDKGIAYFKTQYYGGVKKYQWPVIPLALHGVVILKNGKSVEIHIGEDPQDPVFVITDLLPHLARKQMEKRASEFIEAESLNIIVGTTPVADKKAKDKVKMFVLEYLHKTYGIIEEDFQSAEIEAVPVGYPRDIGFDRSLIGGYGHDDRAPSFAALQALLDIKGVPDRTILFFWSDKEEVGSFGATGAQSRFLFHTVGKIVRLMHKQATEDTIMNVLNASSALSGDVDVALDPDYKETVDDKNTAFLNHGVAIIKYTGMRGKYGGNDADAEYIGKVRKLFNDNKIVWQTGLLGKADEGGGGTIAIYLAALGIHIVDCGPSVLSMHSPYELLSKVDLYATYEAYKVFYEKMRG